MSTTVIAGKRSNTVGEKDSTLVLRGTSIKILWGNKFIDLIKNGKINVEYELILKTANSIENITSDGIYLIEDSVWLVIGGTKILLAGDSTTTYVSYLVEQTDVTSEQKERALTNIGFYYETYEQAQNAGLTKGIIYVLGDNKLYIVKDGVLTEYMPANGNTTEETTILLLYISEYSLMVNGEEYITCDNETITAHKLLILEEGLSSLGATNSYGYRLYTLHGESYLEVDNLIVRNVSEDNITILPIKYYLEENIILSAVNPNDTDEETTLLLLTLLYSDKYLVGDILTTSILLNKEIEYVDEDGEENTKIELVLTSIDFTIEEIEETYIVSTSSIENSTISLLVNKPIYYKLGLLPVARLQDHNYDLFEAGVEQILANVNTRLGSISDIAIYDKTIADYSNIDLGFYSKNAILKDSCLFNTKLYNTEFKNINNIYPKYEEEWFIPEESDDLTIASTKWVLTHIKPMKLDILNNTLNIKTNADNIAVNVLNIATNVTNISANTEAIEELREAIEELQSTEGVTEEDLEELKKLIEANTEAISTNSDLISTNTDNIAANTKAIAINTTNIANNTTNIETNTTNIETNTTLISENTTQITNINTEIEEIWEALDGKEDSGASSDDITNLQNQINTLTELLATILAGPLILVSGLVYRENAESLDWYFTGMVNEQLGIDITQKLTTSINGGVLEITWTGFRRIVLDSCCANMTTSGLVTDYTAEEYKSTDGDKAMYWLGTATGSGSTYIRAMTQADLNNDTAISYDELWGPVNLSHKYGILSFSIIVLGHFMNT